MNEYYLSLQRNTALPLSGSSEMFGNIVNNKKRKHPLGDDKDNAELLLTSRKSPDKKGKERGNLKDSERERQARKQVREKRKRLDVAASIELLTDKLLKVDRGTNFFRHNNQIYFGRVGPNDKKSSDPSEVKNVLPRKRYGGYLSSSFNENNRPLNRTEIITYATKMIKRLSDENEELKVKQLTLECDFLQKIAMSGQEPRRNVTSVHAGTHITRPQDQNNSNPAGTLQSPFVLAHEPIVSSSPAALSASTMSFTHPNPMISSNINQVIYNQGLGGGGGGIYCSSGLNHAMYNDNLVGSLATVNASPFQSFVIQQPVSGRGLHRQLYY